MFKQSLIAASILFIAVPALAEEVTHPFFGPEQGRFVSITSLDTSRYQAKDKTGYNFRTYDTAVHEQLSFGILDNLALDLSIGNHWMKFSIPHEYLDTEDKNIDWFAGLSWDVIEHEHWKAELAAGYGQSESASHFNHGYYKYAEVTAKLGYDFKGIALPYITAVWEMPVDSHNGTSIGGEGSIDLPIYSVRGGVYKMWNRFASDVGVTYHMTEDGNEVRWIADAELSYMFTHKTSIGIYGEYTLKGYADNQADIFSKTIGLRFKTAF